MSKNNKIQEGILDMFRGLPGKKDREKVAANLGNAIDSLVANYTRSSNLLIKNIDKIISSTQNLEKTEETEAIRTKMAKIRELLVAMLTYVQIENAFAGGAGVIQGMKTKSAALKTLYPEDFDIDPFEGLTDDDFNLASQPDNFEERAKKVRKPFYVFFMYTAKQIKALKGGGSTGGISKEELQTALSKLNLGDAVDSDMVLTAFASSATNVLGFLKDPMFAIKKWRSDKPQPGSELDKLAKILFKKKNLDKINNITKSISKYVDLDGNETDIGKLIDDIMSEEMMGNTSYTLQWDGSKLDPPLEGKSEIEIVNGEAKFTKTLDKYVNDIKQIFANDTTDNIIDNIARRNARGTAGRYTFINQRVREYDQWRRTPPERRTNSPGSRFDSDPGLLPFIKNNFKALQKYLRIADSILSRDNTATLLLKVIQMADEASVERLEENKRKTVKKLIHLIEQEIKKSNQQKLVNIPDHEVNNHTIRK